MFLEYLLNVMCFMITDLQICNITVFIFFIPYSKLKDVCHSDVILYAYL